MRAGNLKLVGSFAAAAFVALAMPVFAAQPAVHDVTKQLISAGVAVDGLRALEVGGVLVLRGRTAEKAPAELAGSIAQSLGYARIANLIVVEEIPDDARIARAAERELGLERGLDGTSISVDSTNGVVRLTGRVLSDLQKDMAANLVRNIRGVRDVQMALQR